MGLFIGFLVFFLLIAVGILVKEIFFDQKHQERYLHS
jgi:hypothetical protein